MPVSVTAIVESDLVNTAKSGDRVILVGVYHGSSVSNYLNTKVRHQHKLSKSKYNQKLYYCGSGHSGGAVHI